MKKIKHKLTSYEKGRKENPFIIDPNYIFIEGMPRVDYIGLSLKERNKDYMEKLKNV